MDALPYVPIELFALDAARGVRRRWRVAAYRDLFGELVIETMWGRLGRGGQRLMRRFEDESDALRYVNQLLARRRSAVRRIGVPYLRRPRCQRIDVHSISIQENNDGDDERSGKDGAGNAASGHANGFIRDVSPGKH